MTDDVPSSLEGSRDIGDGTSYELSVLIFSLHRQEHVCLTPSRCHLSTSHLLTIEIPIKRGATVRRWAPLDSPTLADCDDLAHLFNPRPYKLFSGSLRQSPNRDDLRRICIDRTRIHDQLSYSELGKRRETMRLTL